MSEGHATTAPHGGGREDRGPRARSGAFDVLDPASLGEPRGWSHGLLAPAGGRVLFVAGQTARGADGEIAACGFVAQFEAALRNALSVVREAGGGPGSVGRLTIYVTDLDAYRAGLGPLGKAYRAIMGRHYPAMALVEVSGLVDPGAVVEIEATAVIAAPEDEDAHDADAADADATTADDSHEASR